MAHIDNIRPVLYAMVSECAHTVGMGIIMDELGEKPAIQIYILGSIPDGLPQDFAGVEIVYASLNEPIVFDEEQTD